MIRYARCIVRGFQVALTGVAIALVLAPAARATTVKEAIETALATNPDIGVVASNREAVDQELRQARGLYMPQVDMTGGLGVGLIDDAATRAAGDGTRSQDMGDVSLSLRQPLFDGFEASSTVEREQARVESAANRVLENAEVLSLDVIGAYMQVLRTRDLVRLAERNLEVHLNILESLEARLAGGGGSRADVSQTQVRVSCARATLTQNYNLLRDAEADYTRVVGQFPHELEAPSMPSEALPEDLDEAVQIAMRNNLTTRIFEADVRSARAEIGVAEVPLWPSVSLEGLSEYNDGLTGVDEYEYNNTVMLRLDWNLFRGGIDRAARQEAIARLGESKNRRFQAQVDSEREMRQSWFALEASQQSVLDLRDAVEFARETRDAYVQQFEVAQRTLLDVLDAENELFVSASELVTAETNEVLATYRILAVAGQLMNTLGISPPKQSVVVKKTWYEGLRD
jgi:adhesin transport system outer membrane protein